MGEPIDINRLAARVALLEDCHVELRAWLNTAAARVQRLENAVAWGLPQLITPTQTRAAAVPESGER
jgi:hypothetical protein